MQFDEEGITQVVTNIAELIGAAARGRCRSASPTSPASTAPSPGYEGLIAAQECLPNNDARDRFAADFSFLAPPVGGDLARPGPERSTRPTTAGSTQVYESVKPSTGHRASCSGTRSAPKTIELIHEHVHVDAVRDDLETLVLDADLLEAVLGDAGSRQEGQGDRDQGLAAPAQARGHDPRFKELGERLEALKERHEQGLLVSVEFLKELLELATDVVAAENAADADRGRRPRQGGAHRALREARNEETPIIVERVVDDIDEIVRVVRFAGWQNTHAGEREVKKALRKTLFKYKLHQDQELFDRAYGYIRQYY